MLPNKAAYKGVSVAHSSLSSGANYQPINHEPDLDQRGWKQPRALSFKVEQEIAYLHCIFLLI